MRATLASVECIARFRDAKVGAEVHVVLNGAKADQCGPVRIGNRELGARIRVVSRQRTRGAEDVDVANELIRIEVSRDGGAERRPVGRVHFDRIVDRLAERSDETIRLEPRRRGNPLQPTRVGVLGREVADRESFDAESLLRGNALRAIEGVKRVELLRRRILQSQ